MKIFQKAIKNRSRGRPGNEATLTLCSVIAPSFVLLATQEVNSTKLTTFIDTINGKEKTWYVSFSAEVRPRMGARGMVAVTQVQSMYTVQC